MKGLLNQKYDKLLGCAYSVLADKEAQDTLERLVKCMKVYYDGIRKSVKKNVEKDPSQVLITKTLM